jgi:hypothetical protein
VRIKSLASSCLPADIILWVHIPDAKLAWALLADAERQASQRIKKDDAA